jgi:hypothetical protein
VQLVRSTSRNNKCDRLVTCIRPSSIRISVNYDLACSSYCSSSSFLSTPVPEIEQFNSADGRIKSYADLYNFSIQRVSLQFAILTITLQSSK